MMQYNFSVSAVSQPAVRIKPPIFTESNVTLRCIITLNAAVDTGTAASGVDVTWKGPHGAIASSSQIAISGVTGSGNIYESNLIFYTLTGEDTGIYTCRATVSAVSGSPYILRSRTGSDSETITVHGESVSAFLFDEGLILLVTALNFLFRAVWFLLPVHRHMLCIH